MGKFARTFSVAVLLLGGAAGAATAAAPGSIRHLVYNFTYGISANVTQSTSGIAPDLMNPSDSGASPNNSNASPNNKNYTAGTGDHGTITADVLRVQPDSGLVVSIGEQGREERSAPAATCVVYGTTVVICDPNKKFNEEEFALLRFLGRSFVDPVKIDSNNHWRVASSNDQISDSSDFRIISNNGGVLQITENRATKANGAGAFTAATDGKITYDTSKTLPITITEATTSRVERGTGLSSDQRVEITLELLTDSMASR